jgi:FtsP/CotA-like multicopper oxidase with cupredoxin domain
MTFGLFYSHSGLQKADGVYGAIVVRIPEDEGYGNLYDKDEFTLIISDCESSLCCIMQNDNKTD